MVYSYQRRWWHHNVFVCASPGVQARLGRFSEQENQLIRENVADFMVLTDISCVEKLLFPHRFKEEEATIKNLKKKHRFMERIGTYAAAGSFSRCLLIRLVTPSDQQGEAAARQGSVQL